MTEIATIDWFGWWGTSVFPENTAIFPFTVNKKSNTHRWNFCIDRRKNYLHLNSA